MDGCMVESHQSVVLFQIKILNNLFPCLLVCFVGGESGAPSVVAAVAALAS